VICLEEIKEEAMNNFHNEYALPLESIARGILGITDRQRGAIFDADGIELGSFFEVMVLTLRVKVSYQRCLEIDEFINKHADILGVSLNKIAESKIKDALNEYKELLNKIENNELESIKIG